MKKQLVIIHGGDFFDTRAEFAEDLKDSEVTKEDFLFDDSKGWKDNLPKDLGKDFEAFAPEMPSRRDAKYGEWKIWFEKMLPFLDNGVVLVGHSLGGIFLARYLSENDPGVRVGGLFLVAAPFFKKDGRGANKAGFVVGDLRGIGSRADRIFVMHSKDDPVVSFSHAEKYCAALPHSVFVQFKDRGHFVGIEHFSELAKLIQKCA